MFLPVFLRLQRIIPGQLDQILHGPGQVCALLVGDDPLPGWIFIQIEPGCPAIGPGIGLGHDGTADPFLHQLAQGPVHGALTEQPGPESGMVEQRINDGPLGGTGKHETEAVITEMGQLQSPQGFPLGGCISGHGMAGWYSQNQFFVT